jgi:FkbM family methyltransferase
MKFQQLKNQYNAGAVDKQTYIREALAEHQRLFSYSSAIRETDIREIIINSGGVSFVTGEEGILLFAPPNESRVAPIEILNFDRYEPSETSVLDILGARSHRILDIGANIGWHALRLAKRRPDARVFAFEPVPATYEYLQRNVAANQLGGRISTYNYALSERSGATTLFISPTHGTNASLANVANAADVQEITCVSMTIDQWVENTGIIPDLIKCDVEGAELMTFRGGYRTLSKNHPAILSELLRKWSRPFGYHPNDMLHFFREIGYLSFGIDENGAHRVESVNDETSATNFVFLHASSHKALIDQLEAGT